MNRKAIAAVIALGCTAFFSCTRDNRPDPAPAPAALTAPALTARHGILAFASADDYETILALPAGQKQAVLAAVPPGSYRRMGPVPAATARTLGTNEGPAELPSFLQSILNAEGIVQIGAYLYKLDFGGRRVYVLPARLNDAAGTKENYRALAKGDRSHPGIGAFSMDEDVLRYTEAGIESEEQDNLTGAKTAGLFCWKKSGADKKTSKSKFEFVDVNNQDPTYKKNFVDWEISYEKYGIYFSLSAKLKIKKNTSSSGIDDCEGFIDDEATREYSMDFSCRFEGKCNNEYEQFRSGTDFGPLSGENKIVRNFWESGNGLHRYDLKINFRIKLLAIADKSLIQYLNACGHPEPLIYNYFLQPTLYTVYPNFYTEELKITFNY